LPGSNLDLVRAFFAGNPDDLAAAVDDPQWVERVRQGLAGLTTDDFEFVSNRDSVGMPGRREGVEAFLAAYRTYAEMWESYSLKPQRFEEIGDKVLVEAKIAGITRTGGVQLEQDVAAVYTFEDGRIRRIEEFSDPADAYAAAETG
jgi:ketosteroid isomerase-like protein